MRRWPDLADLDVFVNLLSSGNAAVWVAYTWDGENRLVGVEPAGTPNPGDLKLAFVYDYMGRRVEKKVWTWDPQAGQGGAWVLTGHRKFVWNGWLLLMELDGLNDDAVLRKRTWGLDLSGLMGGGSSAGLASSRSMLEGAGGIGGLLAVHDAAIGQNGADYVYFYDANGNVGQLVDLSHTPGDPAGAIVARYEYDPYGNVTSQSGNYAAANPFRFSTKYFDDEAGLGYWGYRYYDPKLGRWVNRDPIGESGGAPLYGIVRNNMVGNRDALGLIICAPATGSLRCFMEKCAKKYNPFTEQNTPDTSGRLSWQLLSCLACKESSYRPQAKGETDDYGIMQLVRRYAIRQCQNMGVLKEFTDDEYGDKRRKACAKPACQPQCDMNDKGEYVYRRTCCEGCEDSIWNIENNICCAAAYLRRLRDRRKTRVSQAQLICAYHHGDKSLDKGGACESDEKARKDPYTREVLECLAHIDRVKPTDTGVVRPPKELE